MDRKPWIVMASWILLRIELPEEVGGDTGCAMPERFTDVEPIRAFVEKLWKMGR